MQEDHNAEQILHSTTCRTISQVQYHDLFGQNDCSIAPTRPYLRTLKTTHPFIFHARLHARLELFLFFSLRVAMQNSQVMQVAQDWLHQL